MASFNEWRQPYLLSFSDLVTESLTLIAGTRRVPCLSISRRRCTPVVVSSVMPWIFSNISGNCSWIISVKSPPSSKIIFASQSSPSFLQVCSRHHSYSSSVSPFQAKTGTPAAAMAAAAWSWVEKIFKKTSARRTEFNQSFDKYSRLNGRYNQYGHP